MFMNEITLKNPISSFSWSQMSLLSAPLHLNVNPLVQGFPGGAVVENLPANAGDTGSSPGLGRSRMPRSN